MRKDPVQNKTTYSETAGPSTAAALARSVSTSDYEPETIARLAYRLWEDRGRPEGSPEYDWFLAEEILRTGQAVS
jgi:hypothetical protein